jgi:transposase
MEKYTIRLTEEERENLHQITRVGKGSAQKIRNARVLLASDSGDRDEDICEVFGIGMSTVHRVRQRCVKEGLEAALLRKKHSRFRPRKIQGEEEAHLIAIACSEPPEGRKRWTMRLLADKLVELEILAEVCATTVHHALKKTNLNRG